MHGINIASLTVWFLSPDWLSRKMEVCNFCEALRWNGGTCGRGVRTCPIFISYTLEFASQHRKNHGNLSRVNWKALGWSGPNAIRLVELAITDDGLDWPAGPCRHWLSLQTKGSTLGQRKHLTSCCIGGLPRQLTLSQSSQSCLWCVRQTAKHTDPRVYACYVRTRGTKNKVNKLECNTCSLRTCVWAADLNAGHA